VVTTGMAVSAEVAADDAAYAAADHAPRQSRLDLIRRSIVVRGPAHCALLPHKGRRLFFFTKCERDRLSYKSWAFSLTERANSI
jgi:hypothetical protein